MTFILSMILSIQACQKPIDDSTQLTEQSTTAVEDTSLSTELKQSFPITIKHQLGDTLIEKRPTKIAALSMNEVDFLDQLDVPIAGMVKDFIPSFLSKYKNDNNIVDLGAIVQPNMERIYTLHPDLILITPLQAQNYEELSQIAPTLHFDINYKNSQSGHVTAIKQHLIALGQIFNKKELAAQKITEIDDKLAHINTITQKSDDKALVILHNNGAFSNFGVQSRYGFIFSELGVKPASNIVETSLHGEPISSEFILNADPDILYIIDRTSVMQHQQVIDANSVSNPLLKNTKAWKNGKVIFVNPDAWYTTSASPTSINIIIDDVLKGYQSF
nr:siderophore ABC transporter substrate-binding protein [Psychrobacter lutiphocae]